MKDTPESVSGESSSIESRPDMRLVQPGEGSDAEALLGDVLPWVHEAGNPYFDWLLGGPSAARAVLERWMRRPSSEISIDRVSAFCHAGRSVAGFIAMTAAELARCRRADTIALITEAGSSGREGLQASLESTKGLFPAPSPEEYYLSKMGVVHDWRGRGLGRQLVTAYLAAGHAQGFRHFRLDVAADNVSAIGLYGRFGFTAEAETRRGNLEYVSLTLES